MTTKIVMQRDYLGLRADSIAVVDAGLAQLLVDRGWAVLPTPARKKRVSNASTNNASDGAGRVRRRRKSVQRSVGQ